MEKPWLARYPGNTPAEINVDDYVSLVEFFENKMEEFADRPAFSNFGTILSYAQLEEKTRYFANFLRSDLGLKKGERVAVMMPNLLQNPIVIFGVLRAGLIVVNTNPLYTARELKHQLNDSGAGTIVVLENFAHVLEGILPATQVKNVVITRMGDVLAFPKAAIMNLVVKHVKKMVPDYRITGAISFKAALKSGSRYGYESVEMQPDDIAFLQYTGGTTGASKGAMLSHRNMLVNMEQAITWLTHTTPPGRELEIGHEIIITALPLYHIFSLTANCLCFMSIGGLNYLVTNPRDLPHFVKELKKIPFTCMTGVNTLFNGLLNTPGFDQVDFSSLKIVLGGGMAVQKKVATRWKKVTGTTLIEAYGLTETSPAVCINPIDLKEFNGSIGFPLPSTDCKITDDEGNELGFDHPGELCVKGPQVMKGYWNHPEETAGVLSSDGWFHTGDIAKIDEQGRVYIVDRKKDMILVSGFNVYPNEIEAVVADHPGVIECGAIGIACANSGEKVKIVVVRKDPDLDKETLRKYCVANLTPYKVPKYIEFKDELPKTNVGKILRRALRETE